MRVSTSWVYSSGAEVLAQKQADLARTQRQLSSGTRVLAPSDDPVGAASALTIQESLAIVERYAGNQAAARNSLGLAESTLGLVGSTLQDVRTLAVRAGNGMLNAADRRSIATQLRSQADTLMGLANTRDGSGGYLFSGYQDRTPPFTRTPAGVIYQGDQGSRALEVSALRTMDIGVNGATAFEGARAGNGSFTVALSAANTGGGIADAGQVVDAAALTGHAYQVRFQGAPGAITYDVVDTTALASVVTGAAFTPGMQIRFGGMQFSVSGTPAANDTVDVAPSSRQSLFKTLDDLAATLESSAAGTLSNSAYHSRLLSGLASIDQAYDQVLGARTSAGVRLGDLNALGAQNATQRLDYQSELAGITGLDYNAAISTLAQQQISLQAAQQSYLRITGLSLFNYL